MNKITKGIAVGITAVSLSLGGCAAISNLNSLLSTATGQALLNVLGSSGSLIPAIHDVITQIDNGIASNTAALQTVCYALPWADSAVDFFGASVGIPATTITQIDSAVAAFKAGPCTTPPTNLAQVIAEGTALFIAIENNLQNGGVPVAVPVSKTLVRTVIGPPNAGTSWSGHQLRPH